MSLTMGTGPFGHAPAGRFSPPVPPDTLFAEPYPRRVRAVLRGETVADTRRAQMLHQPRRLARYWLPRDDVRLDLLDGIALDEPPPGAPGLEGHVAIPWDAMDAWYEEDDEQVGHAPDPYHRIDVRRTSRDVRISLGGELLARSTRAHALFESGLPVRFYLPRADVVVPLEPSDLRTTCAYKGHASWWSARLRDGLAENVVWSYPEPRNDAVPVAGLLAFLDEQVDVDVDGVRQGRPATPWSAPRWWEGPDEAR